MPSQMTVSTLSEKPCTTRSLTTWSLHSMAAEAKMSFINAHPPLERAILGDFRRAANILESLCDSAVETGVDFGQATLTELLVACRHAS